MSEANIVIVDEEPSEMDKFLNTVSNKIVPELRI